MDRQRYKRAIDIAIFQSVSERQCVEWSVSQFVPKLFAMATCFELSAQIVPSQ